MVQREGPGLSDVGALSTRDLFLFRFFAFRFLTRPPRLSWHFLLEERVALLTASGADGGSQTT